MKCFTFFHGELTLGIQTTLSQKQKRLVYLGSKGDKCICKLVFFDKGKDNEPQVDDKGLVHFAYPTKRKYNYKDRRTGEPRDGERVVLKKAYESPTKILLRVNTSTVSTDRINGRWQEAGGWPTPWVRAHGYGSGQRWCDDLIMLDDQDAILIVPAGGGRSDRVVVRNDKGKINCIPERDYHEIMEAHKKEMARIHTLEEQQQTELPEDAAIEEADDKVETKATADGSDDPKPETEKPVEEPETEDSEEKSEPEGKASGDGENKETVIHSEIIGA